MSDERAAYATLLGLSEIGPARLRWLLDGGTASDALARLASRGLPSGPSPAGVKQEMVDGWFRDARRIDPAQVLASHEAAGIGVLMEGDECWPFDGDPEAPGLLFVCGDPAAVMVRPSVAIVGTRRCTAIGKRVARDLGFALGEAGVSVVSGLALGVDGESHRGWLASQGGAGAGGSGRGVPVAVVASGLDTVYPKRHRSLWGEVAAEGAVVSEWPLGIEPSRWKFPARNRIIAALADIVVVVESHRSGGALSTAEEALHRDIPLAVVPGSVMSPASEGTNQLLMDGAVPIRGADDVLGMLSLSSPSVGFVGDRAPVQPELFDQVGALRGPSLGASDQQILSHLSAGSCTIDELVVATQSSLPEVMGRVQALQLASLVHLDGSRVIMGGQ